MIGTLSTTVANYEAGGNWYQPVGYGLIGGVDYAFLTPSDGYNVTVADTTDEWDDDAITNLQYDGEALGVKDVEVAVIKDNYADPPLLPITDEAKHRDKYEDFLLIHVGVPNAFDDYDSIDLNEFVDNRIIGTNGTGNYSAITRILNSVGYTFVVTIDGPADLFLYYLTGIFDFRLQVGIVAEEYNYTAVGENSMWEILGQIMTASLPNTNWFVNVIIAVPFYACIGFMVIMLVSRFIPFISGG